MIATTRLIIFITVAMWCSTLGTNGFVRAFSQFGKSQRFHRAVSSRLFSATVPATDIIPRVKTADAKTPSEGPVLVKGWVRTVRKQKTLAFVEVNDGSNMGGIQCVASFDVIDEATKQGNS